MELNSSRITHVACVYSQKIFMQRKLGQLGLCTVDYMWHSVESKYRIDYYSYTYVTFCIISSLFPVSVLIPSVCGLLSTKLDIYKNMKYHISLCEVFCLEITYQSPIKSLKKKNQLKTDIDALLGKSREICNFTSRLHGYHAVYVYFVLCWSRPTKACVDSCSSWTRFHIIWRKTKTVF